MASLVSASSPPSASASASAVREGPLSSLNIFLSHRDCVSYALSHLSCSRDIISASLTCRSFYLAGDCAASLRLSLSFARARRSRSRSRSRGTGLPASTLQGSDSCLYDFQSAPARDLAQPARLRGLYPPPRQCGDFLVVANAANAKKDDGGRLLDGDDATLAAWLKKHTALRNLDLFNWGISHLALWIIRANLHRTLETLNLFGCTRVNENDGSLAALCCKDESSLPLWLDAVSLTHVRLVLAASWFPPQFLRLKVVDVRGISVRQSLFVDGVLACLGDTLEALAFTLRERGHVTTTTAASRWRGIVPPPSASGDTGDAEPMMRAIAKLTKLKSLNVTAERGTTDGALSLGVEGVVHSVRVFVNGKIV